MLQKYLRFFLACGVVALLHFTSPAVADEVNSEIRNTLDAGDTTQAIQLLEREIVSDPSYHINYYQLGRIYFAREQYPAATEQFEKALEEKSKHYESRYYLGRSQLHLDDLEGARKSFEEGEKKDRVHKGWFQYGMGLVHMVEGRFQDADRKFREAIIQTEKSPNNYTVQEKAEYHIALGDANFRQGIPSLAILEYQKAKALDVGSKEVDYHWAEACLETRDYQCAMEKLREVLTEDSTYAPAWLRAGGIYFKIARSTRSREDRQERFRSVVGSYRRYLELTDAQPDSSTVRLFYELGLAYTELRGYEDAVEAFDKVVQIPYEPRDIYFHFGKALAVTRQYEKAIEAFGNHLEWLKNLPTDFTSAADTLELLRLTGDCYYYKKPAEFYKAIDWYKRALVGNPDQQRVVQNTAVAYHQEKMYRDAIEYYQRRIDMGIDSTYASIYKNAGLCAYNLATQEESGMDEDMIDIDEELAPEAAPVDTIDYYTLATSYFEDYLTYKPDDKTALELAGNTLLFNLRNCSRGVTYLERLLTLEPQNCTVHRSLGFAYFSPDDICTKNYSKALSYFLKAYDCISSTKGACADPDLILYIGQAYHLRAADTGSKDDYKNAFEWYGKVLKCDPGNKAAQEGRNQTQFEF